MAKATPLFGLFLDTPINNANVMYRSNPAIEYLQRTVIEVNASYTYLCIIRAGEASTARVIVQCFSRDVESEATLIWLVYR